ncbi:predicted protein [Pyrenophora tritici-repentis Pt-1C-BFP]|uniref:Uncharacterized protein n=1 Tax=Pyrenophora tritici-repentis (strain Pt-1C-BFP) TaxID=426418 RepID=B2WPL2_PYRTR|nr:uncharacterized protein PTRG_11963 [Pyrenophora tritici-repentis Pt-1C-BFP]EDU46078.1 predicted protein [Pyrenophora tritici-repentis Pt-1C-BFP]
MATQIAHPSLPIGQDAGFQKNTQPAWKGKEKAKAKQLHATAEDDSDGQNGPGLSSSSNKKKLITNGEDGGGEIEEVQRSDEELDTETEEEDDDPFASSGSSDSEAPPDEDEATVAARKQAKRDRKKTETDEQRNARRQATKARRDLQDERQVAETANAGIVGYMEARKERKPPSERPQEVEKIWRSLYPILKTWWKEGGKEIPKSHMRSIDAAQSKIKKYCETLINTPEQVEATHRYHREWPLEEKKIRSANAGVSDEQLEPILTKAERNFRQTIGMKDYSKDGEDTLADLQHKYGFPYELLHGQIHTMGKELTTVKELTKDKFLKTKIEDLEEALRNTSSRKQVQRLEKKLATTRKLREENDKKTTAFLRGVLLFMESLSDLGITPTSVISSTAMREFNLFLQSSDQHQELYQKLSQELEKPTLEQVESWELVANPVYELVETMRNRDGMITDEQIKTAKGQMRLVKTQNYKLQLVNENSGFDADMNSVPVSILNDMMDQWQAGNSDTVDANLERLLDQLRTKEPAKDVLKSLETRIAPANSARLEATANPKRFEAILHPKTPIASGVPKVPEMAGSGNSTRSVSTPPIPSRDVMEKDLLDMDIDSMSLDNDRIKSFTYDNGETEFGTLVATRASLSENPRFHRFIVNAGVGEEKWEFFQVIRGSDLGPGGAESMPEDKEIKFDLRDRKKNLKAHPLCEVGPCVVMSRAEGYVCRAGTKPRQPDTYIRVTYTGLDTADWLSKTEFIQLAGKRYAERKLASLVPAYYQREKYFAACKAQKRHPKTKMPLTAEDLENYPWLFPEEDRLSYSYGEVDEEEETANSSLTRNFGDISTSEAFSKARKPLPGYNTHKNDLKEETDEDL